MVFDDPVRDGETQPRPVPDVFGRKERVEDPPFQPRGNPRTAVADGHLQTVVFDPAADTEHLQRRVLQRIPGVGEDIHEHLLQLNGAARDHGVGGTEIELHGDLPQPQLLADQRQRPQHDLVDGHILVADRGEAAEGTQVRDDL